MALTIERGPQVKIGVRIGYAKAPNAKMVVMSLTNSNIAVVCNGVTYNTGTLTATDTDSGGAYVAGYIATVTLAGLSEFTEYPYSATQGVNVVNGTFRTLPNDQQDFCFYALTCDAAANTGGGIHTGHGFYKNIKQQVQAGGLPCVGILHVDDHGYNCDRRFLDAAAPGLDTLPPSAYGTKYAYAAAWLNYYGLHSGGSGDSGLGDAAAYNTTANTDIGRNPDRVWCMRNLPVWPQWGDWEFNNDIGMDFPTNNPGTPNGYHATYSAGVGQRDGGGLLAWQTFMGPIQPPSIASADTNANHWAFDLGCVQMIATDGITNSNGAVTNYDAGAQPVSSMLGTGQIADILDALNPNAAFTILGLMNGIKYMSATTSEFSSGAQHPIKDHCPTEFAALFTNADSLAAQVSTNGRNGTLFAFVGDLHNGHTYHHELSGGVLSADFYEICLGTVTGSSNHDPANVGVGPYDGSTIEALDRTAGNKYWGVKVSVYGSRAIPEMVIELQDSASNVLWRGRFLRRSGTRKFDEAFVVPTITGMQHV